MLVLTSTSGKHNHSKYRLYSGKLAALIKLAILIRFPEQTLEINMEKRKRFSTLAGSRVRNRTYLYLWLITVLCHSTGTSFASTLSIKRSPLFSFQEKIMFYCEISFTKARAWLSKMRLHYTWSRVSKKDLVGTVLKIWCVCPKCNLFCSLIHPLQ